MEQIQEIEKEEAIQARKDLFEQRKQQKHKIAQLAGRVATVSMVHYDSLIRPPLRPGKVV